MSNRTTVKLPTCHFTYVNAIREHKQLQRATYCTDISSGKHFQLILWEWYSTANNNTPLGYYTPTIDPAYALNVEMLKINANNFTHLTSASVAFLVVTRCINWPFHYLLDSFKVRFAYLRVRVFGRTYSRDGRSATVESGEWAAHVMKYHITLTLKCWKWMWLRSCTWEMVLRYFLVDSDRNIDRFAINWTPLKSSMQVYGGSVSSIPKLGEVKLLKVVSEPHLLMQLTNGSLALHAGALPKHWPFSNHGNFSSGF